MPITPCVPFVGIFVVISDTSMVFSRMREEHLMHIRAVLHRLREPTKCEWLRPQIELLVYNVSADGLSIIIDKGNALQHRPGPINV